MSGTVSPAGPWRVVLLTAVVYAVLALLSMAVAAPPSYASPVYPAAGVALAVAMTRGRSGLVGILLGSFTLQLLLGPARGVQGLPGLLLSTLIALGATTQAALGARLVAWRLGHGRDFAAPRDALTLFVLGGALAGLTSASMAVAALHLIGHLAGSAALDTWLAWWSGDLFGILLATPVALCWVGRPAHLWRPRRNTVAVPLLVMLLAVTATTQLVGRGIQDRLRGSFERDASRAADLVEWGLRSPLHVLEALRGLYLGSDNVSREEFEAASQAWLVEAPHLRAIGLGQRLPTATLARAEAQIALEDGRAFKVFNRRDAPAGLVDGDQEVFALRYVVPLASNARALGVNQLSVPAAREALMHTLADGQPRATPGFRLTQGSGQDIGVVVYRAVRQGTGGPVAGAVFVTIDPADALRQVLARSPDYLRHCLVDRDPSGARAVLVGAADCAGPATAGRLSYRRSIAFAGRQWELELSAPLAAVPDEGAQVGTLFVAAGMLFSALLATLLLTITGRARRVEEAVTERTADLRHEVQERRRAELALRESEARWRAIVDQLPTGVVYADQHGQLREINPRLRELLGLRAGSRLPATIAELLGEAPSGPSALPEFLCEQGGLWQTRRTLQRADGSAIEVQLTLGLLRSGEDGDRHLLGVVEDVTEKHRLELAERAREGAEAASRAKSEFLSRMSHELRTPLNAILGFAQLLALDREPRLTPRQQSWNEQAQQAGWHLLSLINELMDLSRIEAGEIRLELQAVDPVALVDEALGMLRPGARTRGITLVREPADPGLRVLADPLRLRQVLTNLLSNAIKYNRPQGQVVCTVQGLADGACAIRVLDEGAGLSEAQLRELFQPFNRLGREHGDVEGTGLGLVISRRLAEAMGGSLDAESRPGQGACFQLVLPQPGEAHAGAEPAAPAQAPALAASPRPRQSLLYIEDNEVNAEVMRGLMTQRPSLSLTVTDTGEAGLAHARQAGPDLILLDVHLPDMDGLAVLDALQDDPDTRRIPVLMVSADATPASVERAYQRGALGYITKPIKAEHLLAELDRLLSADRR